MQHGERRVLRNQSLAPNTVTRRRTTDGTRCRDVQLLVRPVDWIDAIGNARAARLLSHPKEPMRLEPITEPNLTPEQRGLDARMREGIKSHLQGFVSARDDGALIGPFNPMLHFAQFGKPTWDLVTALAEHSTLPKPAHEVAILVAGARFHTRYELYAHERVAAKAGLSPAKIATLAAGGRPADLDPSESAAFDVATVLLGGGPLPESTYAMAIDRFGKDGVAELVFLIGSYCLVSMVLNAYDISVPGREEGIG